MPVEDSDLVWYLSSAGASEGGAKSATPIDDGVDENLFEDVSNTARVAGGEQIRKLFLANEDGVDAFLDHSIWIFEAPASSTAYIGLGVDHADDDDATAATLTDLTANAQIALVSDGPDTRTVRLRGKDASGDPITEDVVLTGAAEVLSVATFSSLYNGSADSVDASRTITLKQGTGGTTRGQIVTSKLLVFRWLTPTSKSTGIHLVDLVTGSAEPIWTKVVWTADVAPASTRVKLRAQTL